MSKYTPTTEEVETAFAEDPDSDSRHYEWYREAFRRWLAEVERAAAEKAWHDGFCAAERSGEREMPLNPYTDNPYQREETE